jgi:hypothetical protein
MADKFAALPSWERYAGDCEALGLVPGTAPDLGMMLELCLAEHAAAKGAA